MKRLITLSLTLMISFSFLGKALSAQNNPAELTIGVTTRLSGHFFTEKWGSNSADIDVRELIHGLNTVTWEQSGDHSLNGAVIRDLTAKTDANTGDKTYRIVLNSGLAFNDGTPISAYDYAFSALLLSSPQFNALGGAATGMDYLKGYEAYQESGPFSGVGIVDDWTLELTLDGRYLPYFYEIALLNIVPYPIHVIAPGCAVKDDGSGAYIAGKFTEELLRATILTEETGYLHHPYVTAGPFRFVSFDPDAQIARFTKNDWYVGNAEGVKPALADIAVVFASPETALEDVLNGTLDLVNKVSDGAEIEKGIALTGVNALAATSYLRTGLSFLSFACEMGPTRSANVRKALARCVDVRAVNDAFTRGWGMPVYGYYGMGQWMAIERQSELAAFETRLDLGEAVQLLQNDGWVLDENCAPYDETVGGARYRVNEADELERLSVKWAQSEETALSDLLTETIAIQAERVGIELVVTKMPFEQLLKHYYRQEEREYHMFSAATNFNLAFDPYYSYHTGSEFQGEINKTGLMDEELMRLALAMRHTEAGDDEAYLQKWMDFQARWNALQPMIPLYSNIYYDFYRPDLQEYFPNAYVSWATAIVRAYVGAPKEIELPME